MSDPNEGTAWSSQNGPAEAALDFKEPIAENDPNVGTRWADPVDDTKPRVRIARDIDKFINEPIWKCPDCGFETLTENGKTAHLRAGGDGKTSCQRSKDSFKPVKNCVKCGGTGRGSSQCPSCAGSGEGSFTAKCRGCNGKGKLHEGDEKPCNICDGSGDRTYCAECSGSGEITHCGTCGGSGKVAAEVAPSVPPVDADALAKKISDPIIETMKEGFALLAQALAGQAPKVGRPAGSRNKKAKHASSRVVRGTAASGGSEPVPSVEREAPAVGDPDTEPEEA